MSISDVNQYLTIVIKGAVQAAALFFCILFAFLRDIAQLSGTNNPLPLLAFPLRSPSETAIRPGLLRTMPPAAPPSSRAPHRQRKPMTLSAEHSRPSIIRWRMRVTWVTESSTWNSMSGITRAEPSLSRCFRAGLLITLSPISTGMSRSATFPPSSVSAAIWTS